MIGGSLDIPYIIHGIIFVIFVLVCSGCFLSDANLDKLGNKIIGSCKVRACMIGFILAMIALTMIDITPRTTLARFKYGNSVTAVGVGNLKDKDAIIAKYAKRGLVPIYDCKPYMIFAALKHTPEGIATKYSQLVNED